MTAAAFDAHASTYDSVAESALGMLLRERVHAVLDRITAPGDRVVDIGCGSGIDAAWLAPQVGVVHAYDKSPEMVALAMRRCAPFPNAHVRLGDPRSITMDEPVDLVLANFGVVNCVGNLAEFGNWLHALLAPGGYAVLVSMTRWCPVELGVGLVGRNRELVTRRVRAEPDAAYNGLTLRYASARTLATVLGDRFELHHREALGLMLPPFEQRDWVETRHRLRRVLARLDKATAPVGALLGLGDHHIAVFRSAP